MDVKAILLKRIDLKGLLLEDVLKGVIEPAIDKFVADTANPYDNMVKELLLPKVEEALVKFVEDQLAKLAQ